MSWLGNPHIWNIWALLRKFVISCQAKITSSWTLTVKVGHFGL